MTAWYGDRMLRPYYNVYNFHPIIYTHVCIASMHRPKHVSALEFLYDTARHLSYTPLPWGIIISW